MSYGAQYKMGLARQAAGGAHVTVASSYHGFALTQQDVGLEKDELVSQNLIGQFEIGESYGGVNRVTGTIEFEGTPRNLAAAFAASLNHAPAVANSGSLRTYTFLPNTQDYDAFFVKAPWTMYSQWADSTSAECFYDLQFGQMEMTVGQGQFMRGRITANGGSRRPTGIGSLGVQADAADVGILFPWNVTSISLGGAGLGEGSEVTVSLNENVEALYTTNASVNPFKYTRSGFREVTVSGTFYMVNRAILDDFVAENPRRLVITMMNTRTSIQSGYYPTITVDVPRLKITAFKPATQGPGEVSVSFQGRGVIDPTSRYALQVTMITTWGPGF